MTTGEEWARLARVAAEAGAEQWRAAVVAQRAAGSAADHGDFYALAGELVETLRALEQLVGVLGLQVAAYGQHHVLRDDEGQDPAARISSAVHHLDRTLELLAGAERAANRFWSAIGNIAVEQS